MTVILSFPNVLIASSVGGQHNCQHHLELKLLAGGRSWPSHKMKWNYKILTCDSCLENLLILITIKMIVQLTKNDSPLSLSYDHDWYSSMIMKMTMIMKMIIILSPAESINICYKDLWFVYISSTINLPPRTQNRPTLSPLASSPLANPCCLLPQPFPGCSGKSQEATKVKCTICSF